MLPCGIDQFFSFFGNASDLKKYDKQTDDENHNEEGNDCDTDFEHHLYIPSLYQTFFDFTLSISS